MTTDSPQPVMNSNVQDSTYYDNDNTTRMEKLHQAPPHPDVHRDDEAEEHHEGSRSLEDEKKKVFVGNLTYTITEDELKAYFQQIGDVLDVQIIKRFNRSKGFGFVTFATEEAATEAVKVLDKTDCAGRAINVEATSLKSERPPAARRSVRGRGRGGRRAGGRPRRPRADGSAEGAAQEENADLQSQEDAISRSEIQPEDSASQPRSRRRKPRAKRSKAAPAENGTGEENAEVKADEAAQNGDEQTARKPRQKKSRRERKRNVSTTVGEDGEPKPRQQAIRRPRGPPSETTVHVGNLPFSMTSDQLCDLFSKFNIKSAQVVSREGRKRNQGYGFVDLGDHDEQTRVVNELKGDNALQSEGRVLVIKVARMPAEESNEGQGDDASTQQPARIDA